MTATTIKNLTASPMLRTLALVITLIVSMYAFHKKIIMADIQGSVMTKADAQTMKTSLFPIERGERLETDVRKLQEQVREDIKELRQDIKQILWYSKRNHNGRNQ